MHMKWWWKGERLLVDDLVHRWAKVTPAEHAQVLTLVPDLHVAVARLVRYHESITRIKESEKRK